MEFVKGSKIPASVPAALETAAFGVLSFGGMVQLLQIYVSGKPEGVMQMRNATLRELVKHDLVDGLGAPHLVTQKGLLYISMLKGVPFPKRQEVWVHPSTGAVLKTQEVHGTEDDDL